MHIIITGCDKTGKSFLARELSKRLYFPVINRLVPKQNIFIECIDTLTELKSPMIIDRFHIDEEVYGPIKRGKSRFDFRQYKIIELLMLMLKTVNVYCIDSESSIQSRINLSKENEYISSNEVNIILRSYDNCLRTSILTWNTYKLGDDISPLVSLIQKQTLNLRRRLNFLSYRTIGNLLGSILIVGDRYGDKLLPPLIPFGNNEPGLRLFLALEKSNLSWSDIIITNSIKLNKNEIGLEIDNKKALIEECSLPNIKVIVCLGNNAYNNVLAIKPKISNNVIINKIPHPSAWFVYQNKSIESYSRLIDAAIL
ncbi:hypothetical protein HYS94_01695 [Candidatus Daviesbacteria bacterium]|nr:hypothetical protein [Candidatus Daviesbacteria bacterium]